MEDVTRHNMAFVILLLQRAKAMATQQTDNYWLGEQEQPLLDCSLLTIDQAITMLEELGYRLKDAPELEIDL